MERAIAKEGSEQKRVKGARVEKEEIAYCLLQLGIGVEARLPHNPQPDARTNVVTTGLGVDEIWVSSFD